MSDWKEDAIHHKYDPLPDEPRHRKKSKKRHVRSDHKHDYEEVLVDSQTGVYRDGEFIPEYQVFERCRTCGRLGNRKRHVSVKDAPREMPLYRVDGLMGLFVKELGEELRVR